jgi:hypothetical protein
VDVVVDFPRNAGPRRAPERTEPPQLREAFRPGQGGIINSLRIIRYHTRQYTGIRRAFASLKIFALFFKATGNRKKNKIFSKGIDKLRVKRDERKSGRRPAGRAGKNSLGTESKGFQSVGILLAVFYFGEIKPVKSGLYFRLTE